MPGSRSESAPFTLPPLEAVRSTDAASDVWWSRAISVLLVATLVRVAFITSIELTDTEAYYAMWSRFVQLSYYDHPPLVAWLIATLTRLTDAPLELAARGIAAASSTLFALLVYRLTATLFTQRAAFMAMTIVTIVPSFMFTSFLANPEGPLAPAWVAYLLVLYGMAQGRQAWRPLLAGALMGVAFLSKYTAVLLLPVTVGYLSSVSGGRHWFKRPAFYLGGVIAFVFALPVIAWNALHGWPSVQLHLFDRAAVPALGTYVANLGQWITLQWVGFHPLLWPGLLAAGWWTVRRARRDDRFKLFAWAGLPVLFFFFIIMVRVRDAEPHWPMMAYVSLIVAAGVWIDEHFESAGRWLKPTLATAAVFSTAFITMYFVHAHHPIFVRALAPLGYQGARDPMNEVFGWQTLRAAVEEEERKIDGPVVAATHHNVLCGHLLVALDDHPAVYCPSPERTELDFLDRRDPPADAHVLFVDDDKYPMLPVNALPDRECELVRTVDTRRADLVVHRHRLFLCGPLQRSPMQAME